MKSGALADTRPAHVMNPAPSSARPDHITLDAGPGVQAPSPFRGKRASRCMETDAAHEGSQKTRTDLADRVRIPAGVSVVKLWKAGNVGYKSIPELRSINLDRYRGAGREEVRITVAKT